uniref:Uncharacterized protein n=1 Tax=Arundo donax TaxID=35708 RepID=A0A0A9FA37_ARUDO
MVLTNRNHLKLLSLPLHSLAVSLSYCSASDITDLLT